MGAGAAIVSACSRDLTAKFLCDCVCVGGQWRSQDVFIIRHTVLTQRYFLYFVCTTERDEIKKCWNKSIFYIYWVYNTKNMVNLLMQTKTYIHKSASLFVGFLYGSVSRVLFKSTGHYIMR